MPFESEAQRRWMYANHPEMAKEWEAHTPKGKKLPRKVSKGKKRRRKRRSAAMSTEWVNEYGVSLATDAGGHQRGKAGSGHDPAPKPTLDNDTALALWAADVTRECLLEAGDDVEAGLAAVEYILNNYDPPEPTVEVFLAHDVHNRQAQDILNRAVKSARGMSAAAKRDLAAALKAPNSGEAIINFVDKYRLQLAKLLTTTQLAAVLEGAQEVAAKVPPLGSVPVEGLPVAEQERILEAASKRELWTPPTPPANAPEAVHFPTIEAAVKNLAERRVMTRDEYDALDAAARAKAFTVANVAAEETLTKIRDSLAENVNTGTDYEVWKKQILQDVDTGTFMSDAHQETVFRTNVQTAFSDGQMAVLSHPLVRSGFPYSAYDAIHDDRVRENHLALEKLGIQETNIYRNDDPVFQTFRPPWDYNDRCGWTPITVRQAAEHGISEAQEWLKTGVEPADKAFVKMPDFRPPPGFQRVVSAAPLSIQLSLQPMVTFSVTPNREKTHAQRLVSIDDIGRSRFGGIDRSGPVVPLRADSGELGTAQAVGKTDGGVVGGGRPRTSTDRPDGVSGEVPLDDSECDQLRRDAGQDVRPLNGAGTEGSSGLSQRDPIVRVERPDNADNMRATPGDGGGARQLAGGATVSSRKTWGRCLHANADLRLSVDDAGHQHRGKGPGGGQFTNTGGGDGGADTTTTDKPDRKSILRRSLSIAKKVGAGLKSGIKKVAVAIDKELNGGGATIIQGMKNRSPAMIAQGIAQAVTSSYNYVHQEVWENAAAQLNFGGAHMVGKTAAKVAMVAEVALLRGVSKFLRKLGLREATAGKQLSVSSETMFGGDNAVDDLIVSYSVKAIKKALAAVYEQAGVKRDIPSDDKIRYRLLKQLRGEVLPPESMHLSIWSNEEEIDRAQLIAEILVILYGDDAEGVADELVNGDTGEDSDFALSIMLATPKVTRRYGRRPGPSWTSAGTSSKGQQIWVWNPPSGSASAPAAPPPAPTPAAPAAPPAPVPTPPPAPSRTSAFTPVPTPPPSTLPAGGQRARAASIVAYNDAMTKLSAGQQLTAADKASLSTKLTNMPTPLLQSLHTALGGTGAVGNARATAVAVRAILTGAAAAAPSTPPPPAPAPTPPPPVAPTVSRPPLHPRIRGYAATFTAQNPLTPADLKDLFSSLKRGAQYVSDVDTLRTAFGLTPSTATTVSDAVKETVRAIRALNRIHARNAPPAPTPTPAAPAPTPATNWPSSLNQAQKDALDLIKNNQPVTQQQLRDLSAWVVGPLSKMKDLEDVSKELGINIVIGSQVTRLNNYIRNYPHVGAAPAAPPIGSAPPPVAGSGPPGPPPRPGLVWNPTTHRWVLPVGVRGFNTGYANFDDAVNKTLRGGVISMNEMISAEHQAEILVPNADVKEAIEALGGKVTNPNNSQFLSRDLRLALAAVSAYNASNPSPAPTPPAPVAPPTPAAPPAPIKTTTKATASNLAWTKDEVNWDTGKATPGTLNGIDFAPAPPKFWEKVKDVDVGEPPTGNRHTRASVMIQEPDGRVWIVQPTNGFGNRKYTLPGGTIEKGLTDQQNALKETWEETGLQVEITGYLGDFDDSNYGDAGKSTRTGRLYLAKRVGGAPWDAKVESHIISNKTGKAAAESETITLVTPEKAAKLLHRTDDLAQLMTIAPIKIDQTTRGSGSEPLKKYLAGIKPAVDNYIAKKTAAHQATGNAELHVVQNQRGFNNKPTVVSKKDFDAMMKNGEHIELLRGVQDTGYGRNKITANELADQFKTGDHFPGYGIFGSGTYADAKKGSGNIARSQYGAGGALIRMALPKTAKIIKISELEKAVPQVPDNLSSTVAGGNGTDLENWLGVQAALAGYDAIEVDDAPRTRHRHYGNPAAGHHFHIILNRSILVVQSEDATGHIIR